MSACLTRDSKGIWRLQGELSFHDAPLVCRHAANAIARSGKLSLDLSTLTRYDSSLFSLLLSLYREAEVRAGEFFVKGLPPEFLSQAEFYGCRELMRQICDTDPSLTTSSDTASSQTIIPSPMKNR